MIIYFIFPGYVPSSSCLKSHKSDFLIRSLDKISQDVLIACLQTLRNYLIGLFIAASVNILVLSAFYNKQVFNYLVRLQKKVCTLYKDVKIP